MINLLELIENEKQNGYSEANAGAKVCQDLLLKAISDSTLSRNATIKSGVVMRSKTNNIRRATQDLDIDFIKYSLSDSSIDLFIKKVNCIEGIKFIRFGNIEELNQQDYHGKRVFIKIIDLAGNQIYYIPLQLMENYNHFLILNNACGSVYLESTDFIPNQLTRKVL